MTLNLLATVGVGLRHLRRVSRARHLIPEVSFITIHYAYFILTGLLSGIIIWGSAKPERSVSFTDALFLAVSSMTEAGLNTANLSSLNTFQQFVLFLLMMLGSAIFVSAFIVIVRLKAFEREFVHVFRSAQHSAMPSARNSPKLAPQFDGILPARTITLPALKHEFELSTRAGIATEPRLAQAEGALQRPDTPSSHRSAASGSSSEIDLTMAEREQLGGTEYKAVLLLSYLVPLYFVIWQFLTCISCGWWIAVNRADTTRANGINPWWTGAFNAVSAFNNNGMSLLDANMVSAAAWAAKFRIANSSQVAFQDSYFLLITMGLLILAGNTAYPIFLRMIVWNMWKWLPDRMVDAKQTLRFLLDHPRRCYTNLFPSRHTWWLAMVIVILNGVDWAAFEILNVSRLHNEALTKRLIPFRLETRRSRSSTVASRSLMDCFRRSQFGQAASTLSQFPISVSVSKCKKHTTIQEFQLTNSQPIRPHDVRLCLPSGNINAELERLRRTEPWHICTTARYRGSRINA